MHEFDKLVLGSMNVLIPYFKREMFLLEIEGELS